ncbi:MAG: AgmX/PglI C-terminal domain-containing protein [Chitinispirillaceae bacterium]|nr:AgmX/PglI C-terminal domain-containing protein [Chitinispirillaceae bacterium]
MKYKVLIQKCSDPQRATRIAEEIARWSGSTVDVVLNVITQKPVCIRKEADEAEARRLQEQFGTVGATVELVPLGQTHGAAPVASVATAASAQGYQQAPRKAGDDDEDDEPGRVLSEAEYAEMLKTRGDIFKIEKQNQLRNTELVCMILAILVGIYFSTREIVQIATDFFEKVPEERVAKLVKEEVDATLDKKKEEKKEEEIKSDKKKLTPKKSQGKGGMQGGGGDPRARVTHKGVLGIISGQIKGKSVASADIFGKGGFATDIDAILSGVGGLKSGGSGGVGRKGVAGIGYGAGYGSGFGGSGAGGIDDLIGGLMGGDGGGLNLKKRGSLKISAPEFLKGGALTGGRSKASIMRVVMQNLAALRYAYNKRLRDKPGLNGKITCKFAIDEFGKVIFCQVVESTMGDSELETLIAAKIKLWVFEKIDKPGDVTEVVYPFVFSQ